MYYCKTNSKRFLSGGTECCMMHACMHASNIHPRNTMGSERHESDPTHPPLFSYSYHRALYDMRKEQKLHQEKNVPSPASTSIPVSSLQHIALGGEMLRGRAYIFENCGQRATRRRLTCDMPAAHLKFRSSAPLFVVRELCMFRRLRHLLPCCWTRSCQIASNMWHK